jgi:3',5'-cyclic AMP phosphodiesterase CpdA
MLTIAHLSDPHVGPLPRTRARDLCNKRVLGFLAWKLRRSGAHLDGVLAALVEDLRAQAPAHTVVTGDITNIALPEEFERAATWLTTLGPPRSVSVVPGNHDAYVSIPWESSLAWWAEYMGSDDAGGVARSAGDFPFVRVRDRVALVGVSTACPMAPFLATGAIGRHQLERLRERLRALGRSGLFRIVFMHHPPMTSPTGARRRLVDARSLRAVIAECGAELVLHGHAHLSSVDRIDSSAGSIPVVGAPSASPTRNRGDAHARYHLYRFELSNEGPRMRVEVRGLDANTRGFTTKRTFKLSTPFYARGFA